MFVTAQLPQAIAPRAAVAPMLRGAASLKDEKTEGAWRRLILDFRATPAVLDFVNGAEVARYSQAGVVTPDHTIRTKNWPLLLPAPADGKLDDFAARRARRRRGVHRRLPGLFRAQQCARRRHQEAARSAAARRAAFPGSACSASGAPRRRPASPPISRNARSRRITDAEAIGRFESISEADMFDMEYWSLEQAKLGAAKELPLAGQVAAITGAAGTIGFATAKAFAAAGAEVALLDIDEAGAAAKAKSDRRRGAARSAAT